MTKLFLAFLIQCVLQTNANVFKLQQNIQLTEIECGQLVEAYCIHPSINDWCKWNQNLSICENNYEFALFLSPWEVAAMPQSVISLLTLLLCMTLYWLSGVVLNHTPCFKAIDQDKRNKCQIYIFELIGTPLALSYLLCEGTFNVVFQPSKYTDIGPKESMDLVRSMCSSTFLIYMYSIEMLTNKLRWSLKLHHVSVIVICSLFMVLLDGSADLASIRCMLAISLYPFTESNVFAQLLLYRVASSFSWQIHLVSTLLYATTRLLTTITFIICYVSWINTDEVYDQLYGNKSRDFVYITCFIMMPITTVLLNIAQFQTIKALWYMTMSVLKRHKTYNKALRELKDIFIKYDKDNKGHWTKTDWKQYVIENTSYHHHMDTLWDIFLFDIDITSCYLRWCDFRKIFEAHILFESDNKSETKSVNQVIATEVETLLQQLSEKENNPDAALRVYRHIQTSIQMHQSMLDLPEEIEPIHSMKSKSKTHSIISFGSNYKQTKLDIPKAVAINIAMVDMNQMSMLTPTRTPTVIKKHTSMSDSEHYPMQDLKEEETLSVRQLQHIKPQQLIPNPSLPIWYANKSITIPDTPAKVMERELSQHDEEDKPEEKMKQMLFYAVISPLIYACLFMMAYMSIYNMYHILSWIAALFSVSFILMYIKVFVFAKHICYFEMHYTKINGIDYAPDHIVKDHGRSFDSVCMYSHVRGTSAHKYHTLFINMGSLCLVLGAVMKLFDNNKQESVAVCFSMLAGIGGITMTSFEVYSSPTYSVTYNLMKGYIHLLGAFMYTIFSVLAYFLYNRSIFSSCLFASPFILLVVYKVIGAYMERRDSVNQTSANYTELTNRRSKVNMCMEIFAILPAVYAGCRILYEFGQ